MQESPVKFGPKTFGEFRDTVDRRVVADDDFRARLIADPKATIAADYGLTIPEDFEIQVHETDENTGHIVLPFPSRLTDQDLEQVSGGLASVYADPLNPGKW